MSRKTPKTGAAALADFHLWTEVTKTLDPLRPDRVRGLGLEAPLPMPPDPSTPAPPPVPEKPRRRYSAPAYRPPVSMPNAATPPERPIEPRVRRRLMRGQIGIDGRIDLHGMRQSEAHAALGRFIEARAQQGDRTVLVITGKGLRRTAEDGTNLLERGVLRAMLPVWLAEPRLAPMVAGIDVAARGHGGDGAFYVRLRRPAR
ncbi:hypothetical protein EMQ25_12600 [Arsenicitalea aurantiaca]|uniref:Smr domain-containing protein n=1 Tax=Arsenicitalea aurantiaca TaxID=1783274 RepID=A0A433X7V8_9HYPH|nr:Smr/MutS family protein [Arsenicitalea aurantiaca]RUT30154.1 hypothetical protein EMQ25_12600 [Arsenicitalea aurantiaca]